CRRRHQREAGRSLVREWLRVRPRQTGREAAHVPPGESRTPTEGEAGRRSGADAGSRSGAAEQPSSSREEGGGTNEEDHRGEVAMRQTFKVSPMVSETALQDAVILVG